MKRKLRPRLRFAQAIPALVIPFMVAGSTPAAAQRPPLIDTTAIRNDTRVLAADSLGGRATGSRGGNLAAAYIARRLAELGLRPVAGDSYLHSVPLQQTIIGPSRLVIRAGTDSSSFVSGRDFHVANGSASAFRSFGGPAILAGTAENARQHLANMNVSGTVVVLAGALPEYADSLLGPWQDQGIAGIVLLFADDESLAAAAHNARNPRLHVAADVGDMVWQSPIPCLLAGPRVARALLQGVNLSEAARSGQPFRPVPLERAVQATIEASPAERINASNVIAQVPGTDPNRADELLLYTAHYDHLGVADPDAEGDSVYNGFSDNAAGVAMLLAIADALRRDPLPITVAFAFLTGEERGLLGSSYLASNAPWRLDRLAAVINLDGGAPPHPPASWRIAGAAGSPLGALGEQLGRSHGWTIQLSAGRPNSDYWPFLKRGVPSAFIIPGNEWEGTTTEERDALRARWDRYHRPADEWHPDFPFSGLARYASFALELGRAVTRPGLSLRSR
jgi:Zn-dependent M28 family amino/carboxypeptidase